MRTQLATFYLIKERHQLKLSLWSFPQEVENHVGEELCRLFAEDSDVEWSTVLRRSKDSARRVQVANGGVRPRGPMAPLQLQQQQQQHHQQQQQQQGGGGRRGFRDRNRNRGGFGSGRSGINDSHDMGRYTAQINQKRDSILPCGRLV